MNISSNPKKILMEESLTIWLWTDVSEPKPSVPNTNDDLEEGTFCGRVDTAIKSPGVCVDGDEGELIGGPVVFTVPELLAGPEDDAGFLFRPVLLLETLN